MVSALRSLAASFHDPPWRWPMISLQVAVCSTVPVCQAAKQHLHHFASRVPEETCGPSASLHCAHRPIRSVKRTGYRRLSAPSM